MSYLQSYGRLSTNPRRLRLLELRSELLRRGLVPAPEPVKFSRLLVFEADDWQESVLRMDHPRMLLNCSRQAGKSTVTALLAVYRALYKPGLTLLISPSLRQSGELFRKVKDWFGALPDYQKPKLVEDNQLSCQLENGARIISLPSSESTIRGYSSVDLIIEDEASRVDDMLYYSIRPMLAVSGGAMILMSTPFGKRGHFYEEWAHGSDVWQRIEVRATQIARITPEFLDEERKSLGEQWFNQEYNCKFVDPVDSVFSTDDIDRAFSHDIPGLFVATDEAEEVEPLKL